MHTFFFYHCWGIESRASHMNMAGTLAHTLISDSSNNNIYKKQCTTKNPVNIIIGSMTLERLARYAKCFTIAYLHKCRITVLPYH